MTLREVPKRKPLYCSFCGKERGDVCYLIAGPCAFICNECIELCREMGQKGIAENSAIELKANTERC